MFYSLYGFINNYSLALGAKLQEMAEVNGIIFFFIRTNHGQAKIFRPYRFFLRKA